MLIAWIIIYRTFIKDRWSSFSYYEFKLEAEKGEHVVIRLRRVSDEVDAIPTRVPKSVSLITSEHANVEKRSVGVCQEDLKATLDEPCSRLFFIYFNIHIFYILVESYNRVRIHIRSDIFSPLASRRRCAVLSGSTEKHKTEKNQGVWFPLQIYLTPIKWRKYIFLYRDQITFT